MIFYLSSVSSETPADVAELADAIDLGSIVNRRAGSSPVIRTTGFDNFYDLKIVLWFRPCPRRISRAGITSDCCCRGCGVCGGCAMRE